MKTRPKLLKYSDEAREKIRTGVEKLSEAVQATLGPCGRNVLIEKEGSGPVITKDGVSVAREVHLSDPVENLGAQAIKEVSMRASRQAGDGTTTATVLGAQMYKGGLRALGSGANPVEVKRGMDLATGKVIDQLRTLSQEVKTNDEIRQVATISANNDQSVGGIIAEAMKEVGKDGVIQVDQSRTSETTLEIVEGMQIERGYISPYFVTNNSSMTATLENPYILICDKRISSTKEILGLLETCSKEGRALLIIAEDVDGEALATIVLNKARGILNVCAIKAPGYGDKKAHMLQDVATLTKAEVVSTQKGMRLDKLTKEMLGNARSVLVSQTETVIVDGAGNVDTIKERIELIKTQYEKADSDYEKQSLKERMSKLIGGVAVLNVGAATELELKEKKDRVDDALHATRAAVEEGIVPGGGIALLVAARVLADLKGENDDQNLGIQIVRNACAAPFKAIIQNSGKSPEAILDKVIVAVVEAGNKEGRIGYDARNGVVCDMIDAGIIDPTKVTRTALELANSVAGTLLTTECVISFDPDFKEDVKQPQFEY